jgi:CBS domain-containing protein
MKVSEVMTTEVESVQMNSTLEEAASIMKVENVGAVPVVDEDDDLVGIITDRDIVVRCVAEGKNPAETNVEEVLSHELETIEPDVEVEEAAQLMAERQIRRLPVCEDGELVGMLSIGDLAVKSARAAASSDALREISKGVKESDITMFADRSRLPRLRLAGAHEGGSRAAHAAAAGFNDDEDFNLEFSDEKDLLSKDLLSSDVRERHANRHHQASQDIKASGGPKRNVRPISEGKPRAGSRDKKRGQEPNTQSAGEDAGRKTRVLPFRDQDQARSRRGTRKTG